MGKLSLSKEYYFSSIETSDYSVLEKKHNLERLIMCENWEDAERELYSLEKALSLDIPVNSQYVQIMKYIIDNDLDKIEPKDKIEILRQILSITVTDIPENDCVEAQQQREIDYRTDRKCPYK